MSDTINEKDLKKQEEIKRFESIREEMINKGYKENLGIITVQQANIYSLLTAGPIALICFIIYINKWDSIFFEFTPNTLLLYSFSIISSYSSKAFIYNCFCCYS